MAPLPEPTNSANDTASGEILTLVLVDEAGNDDRYAVVPVPKTYEDAAKLAIECLGEFMNDAVTTADIKLRRSLKNRKDEWIWAEIPPAHWTSVIDSKSREIGVFVRIPLRQLFIHGALHLLWCLDEEGKGISWTYWDPKYVRHLPRVSAPDGINRPETHADAVKAILDKAPRQSALRINSSVSDKDTITFCTFLSEPPSVPMWVVIPPDACQDDAKWQNCLPPPGGILGVIIKKAQIA